MIPGKLLACIPVNKSAEANSLAVRVALGRRAEFLRQHPEIYYVTDHYAPHPIVLVRLAKITRADLTELLREAHRFVMPAAPPRATQGRREAGRPPATARKKLTKR